MRQAERKLKPFRRQAADGEQLRAKAQKLGIEFANADLDAAHTFLDLARLDFQSGESEHASRLLKNAEHAAEVVESIIKRFPENALPELQRRLEALNKAIGQVKALAEAS